MGEDTTATTPQAGEGGTNLTPQAGGTTTSTDPQAGESHHTSSKNAEDYERIIADLRKENAGHRTRLKKFEEDASKAAEAQLSKEQLLEKQLSELRTQHEEYTQAQTERIIKHEVALEAVKLGIDPNYLDEVARFLDWETIDTDEHGNPTNIRALVEQLVKKIPGLKSRGSVPVSSGGATNPPRSQTDGNGEITAAYVQEVMSGKIRWQDLTPERRTAILTWQTKNPFRF